MFCFVLFFQIVHSFITSASPFIYFKLLYLYGVRDRALFLIPVDMMCIDAFELWNCGPGEDF